jgi:hypothetical protein
MTGGPAGDAGLRIDHPVRVVPDLDRAAERWRREYGLDSSVGGRHARWGTANRIVPLGDGYVELIGVADPEEAGPSEFGRSVMRRAAMGETWLTFAVATDDLDGVAARLGLEVTEGSRERPDGVTVRWRSAGQEALRREDWMPFFIEWRTGPELHPGRTRAGHGISVDGISWIEVGGDAARLRDWLGGSGLPIRVTSGPAGVRAVALSTASGDVVIR